MTTNKLINSYQSSTKLDQNSWITPPDVADPENLPRPLGWHVLVRPYPVAQNREKSSIYMPDAELDFLNHITCIGRVVAIGDCAWNRTDHRNKDGEHFNWVEVGDFVSYPKNVGARRKFKGVSYVLLSDDDVVEHLTDPQVFDEGYYKIEIPQEHLEKYNTVYKKGE